MKTIPRLTIGLASLAALAVCVAPAAVQAQPLPRATTLGTAPSISMSSTGGVITFTITGANSTSYEVQDVYNGVTKHHTAQGSTLTLKGKAGKSIKFRVRALTPKRSAWSAWQTATVA